MAEDRLIKTIKPVQGETLERSFSGSNNLRPVSQAQAQTQTVNSSNNSDSNKQGK